MTLKKTSVEESAANSVPDLGGYTISEWCAAYKISRQTYYNLKNRGLAPEILKIGNRTIITYRASRRWEDRMAREATTAA